MTDHARAIEVGARAAEPAVTDEMKRIRALFSVTMDDKEDLISYAKEIVRLRAAIASGELVPATAVAAERERCAALIRSWTNHSKMQLHAGEMTAQEKRTTEAVLNAIDRQVSALPEPASGELVVVPRVPTEAMVEAGWDAANRDIGGDVIGTIEIQSVIGRTVWTAMLNAATKDGERK